MRFKTRVEAQSAIDTYIKCRPTGACDNCPLYEPNGPDCDEILAEARAYLDTEVTTRTISFDINNGGTCTITQQDHDTPVIVKLSSGQETEISAPDFITMLNFLFFNNGNGPMWRA